jgi:3-oxoacyl-[acyl-carrier protein] reductase
MSTTYFAEETLLRMQKITWGRLITITSSAVKQPAEGLLFSNSIRAAVTVRARTAYIVVVSTLVRSLF